MDRTRLLLYLGLWDQEVQKALKQAERGKADAFAGPNQSFPLYADGTHLAAAWDLAGHADDPQEVRKNILAFAKAHKLMHLLPMDAQHMANVMEVTRKAFADGQWPDLDAAAVALLGRSPVATATPPVTPVVAKADSPVGPDNLVVAEQQPDADDQTLALLLQMVVAHESGEGDEEFLNALRGFCAQNGLSECLAAMPAGSGNDDDDADDPVQKAKVRKAKTVAVPAAKPGQTVVIDDGEGIPVAKGMLVTKSWSDPGTGDVFIEGWVSTEARDQQKDIVPPESFSGALGEYMARYAPLTTEHQLVPNPARGELTRYPVGHMQRVALVRDGMLLQEAVHPTDPAEFEHFPGYGTGAYGRGVINEATAASQVMKGNMAGFSWVGRLKEYEPLPDGGKRYGRIEPWMETTLSAFPVNSSARLLASGRTNKE